MADVTDNTALNRFELVENGLILPQDAESLLQISQLQIVCLYRAGNAGLGNFNFGLFGVGIAFGYRASCP